MERKLELISFTELLAEPDEEAEHIIDPLLPAYNVMLITGRRGKLKTCVSHLLAKSISTGERFLGWSTTKTPVTIVDLENRPYLIKRRLTRLRTPKDAQIYFALRRAVKGFNVEKDHLLIAEACKGHVVIIDSLAKVHKREENKNEAMTAVMEVFLNLVENKTIKAFILIHHQGKNPELGGRGASSIEDNSDIVVELSRNGNICKFSCVKHRDASEDDVSKVLRFTFSKDAITVEDVTSEELDRFLSDLKDLPKEAMNSQSGIIEALSRQWSREKTRELLNKAIEKDILTASPGPNNALVYTFNFKHKIGTIENCGMKLPCRHTRPKLYPNTRKLELFCNRYEDWCKQVLSSLLCKFS